MSIESEKAAKWDMLMELKAERYNLSVLYLKAREIAEVLEHFGKVFANPSWSFRIAENSIQGRSTNVKEADVILPYESLNRETICALVNEINKTQFNIKKLESQVKEAGL
jgi:hypothetical protein